MIIDLFLPYLIGMAISGAAADSPSPRTTPQEALPETFVDPAQGIAPDPAPLNPVDPGPETAARAPEPQVPTGKYTTAVEVRPILEMTIPNWVAIREYEGQDWLYFTHLLSWRCGLWEVRYGLNGAPPVTPVALEECHDQTVSPNAMVDTTGAFPIYITQPAGSIERVDIEIVYDDGTTGEAVFARQSVLLP